MECAPAAEGAPRPASAPFDQAVFFRWGWVALVGGCLLLAFVELAAWEVALRALGFGATSSTQRWLYLARAVTTSALLAVWVGWFVLDSRRRLETARGALHREEDRLAENSRRVEQAAGRAAMLRVVGHEVRNPLNGLLLHCRALRRTFAALPLEARTEAMLVADVIEGEARRVSSLIDDYMARGQAADLTMASEPVDMSSLVAGVVGDLREEAAEKLVTVTIDVRHDLPHLDGSRELLAFALNHVVRNAIEAVSSGGRVHVEWGSSGDDWTLDVLDDGPGFADGVAALRPFYSTKSDGAGLGLTIVRDVARAHRGTVTIDGSGINGGGARVGMRIPRHGGVA